MAANRVEQQDRRAGAIRPSASRWRTAMAVALGLAVPLAMLAPMPAAAQFSESYKFLDSVRKKEGDKIEEALGVPGTQIINTRDVTTGQSALHIVTERRDLVWIQYLVAKGANVNIHDNRGVTPLDLAVTLDFAEGVDFLINAGAKVDEPNNTGETPLIDAVTRRDLGVVRLLLKAGANPERPDNSGRSARDYAALSGKDSPIASEIESWVKTHAASKAGPRRTYGPTF